MRNQLLGNRYRIHERIGEGGMAFVYVATDEKLGRKVAIKVLHEHMEKNPDIRKRFQLEAQAVSVLEHPNIVKIYDFSGEESQRLWIVTEVIRGKNLAQYVQQFTGGWLHPVIAMCVVRETCKALEKAHSSGIVHRDIKPENIMLTNEGRLKLMDFGIAKDLAKSNMTLTGTFMGSPSYMSPEQIRGRDVDHRSDLYSLSILFYEIVTGRLPFTGQTTHDVVLKIMEGGFVHPRYIVPSLPQNINDTIVKGMTKEPAQRFQSAASYGAHVESLLKELGFDESHIELERFFINRSAYEERLAQKTRSIIAPAGTLAQKLKREPKSQLTLKEQEKEGASLSKNRGMPQRPNTPPPYAKKSGPSPFHGDDTWQKHVPAAATRPPLPGEGRTMLPPPVQMPPRPRQATLAVAAAGNAAASAPAVVDVSSGRRQAGLGAAAQPNHPQVQLAGGTARLSPRHMQRPRRALPPSQFPRQHWLHYVFGFALVGTLAGVSLWGFWTLQNRLAQHQGSSAGVHGRDSTGRTLAPGSGGGAKPQKHQESSGPTLPRSQTAPVNPQRPGAGGKLASTHPPVAGANAPDTAQKPANTAKPTSRKGGREGPRLAAGQTVVRILPAETPNDPGLHIETVEIRRAKKSTLASFEGSGTPANAGVPVNPPSSSSAATASPGADASEQPNAGTSDSADKGEKAAKSPRPDASSKDDLAVPADKSDKTDKAEKQDKMPTSDKAAGTASGGKIDPGLSGKASAAPASGKARIMISSQPAAEIFVDGKRLGTTVDNTADSGWVTVPSGRHALELRRQGYPPYQRKIDLAADEQKQLPRVVLASTQIGATPHTGAVAAAGKVTGATTALTLRANVVPVVATIRNLDSNATQSFAMKNTTRVVNLPSGHYHIRIERPGDKTGSDKNAGDAKERDLTLTGNPTQLTFSADFKDKDDD